MKINALALIIPALFFGITVYSQCLQSATSSKKGVFNIEAESARSHEGWTEHTTGDFTKMIYMEWTGEDHFDEPGYGIMRYPIHVKDAGTYNFYWRCKVGKGDNPAEHNDSWLKFPDADATFAVLASTNDTIRPHGICNDDCPNGTGSDGWYKVFSSFTTDWTWTSRTSDNEGHEIKVQFDEPGLYHIEISGRSEGHYIDKLMLFPHYLTLKDALLK